MHPTCFIDILTDMKARHGFVLTAAILAIALAAFFLLPSPASAPTAFTSENVTVFFPLPETTLPRVFTVTGEARGTWYFEASFPVQVRDADSALVGQGIAEAKSDWMTTEFVPFTAEVTVENFSGPAMLVLLKDNPSGLPENADAVEFPIVIE